MASRYDIVVIGAGHNGLVAAAYLAKAGRSVLVVEKLDQVGGTASTEEFAPGFRSSTCFASSELLHPSISRDLQLERHGLRWLVADEGTTVLRQEGDPVTLSPDTASSTIARHSKADARAFEEFSRFSDRVANALGPMFARPLPRLEPRGLGDALELMTIGWRLRRLGKKEMPEAMRLLPMPLSDVLGERFENDFLKAAIAAPGLTASWLGPHSPGGGLNLLYHRPAWCSGPFTPPRFVAGGLGNLSNAIAEAATASGAKIRTASAATEISIEDGRATGVILEGDEEVMASRVVSALDPRTTLLRLADPSWLDPEISTDVCDIRMRGTVAIVKLALDRLPAFAKATGNGSSGCGRIQIGCTLEYLEKAFDNVKYGRLPTQPSLEITLPSVLDPSLAPESNHVMHVWVQHVPHRLQDGSWRAQAERLGDIVVAAIERHDAGFSQSILHRQVMTPADIEQRYGLTDGCLYQGEMALDQMLYMRPIPGWYDYDTPIEGLHLCGPGCHPGGGVTGLPGKNAAAAILAAARH